MKAMLPFTKEIVENASASRKVEYGWKQILPTGVLFKKIIPTLNSSAIISD
jgi:hypothetical protein